MTPRHGQDSVQLSAAAVRQARVARPPAAERYVRSANHHAINGGDHASVRITGTQQTIEEAPT